MQADKNYYVKVRMAPARAGLETNWGFLTPNGGRNRLKLHAARFRDKEGAEKTVANIRANHPEVEAKVVYV